MKQVIGIDVGKYYLDICDQRCNHRISNTVIEIKQWINTLKKNNKTLECLVVFEATGGYEAQLKKILIANGIGWRIVHPNKIRAFAKSIGLLAKTDKLDAALIKRYAEVMELTAKTSARTDTKIQGLLKRREQLMADKLREGNRLDKLLDTVVKRSIRQHIRWIEKTIKQVESQLKQQVKASGMQDAVDLLASVPGVADLTALYVLTYLPEIKEANQREVAALAGVAPYNRDSGKHQGKRFTQGGRAPLRHALYMSALSSINYNPELSVFYKRLRAAGKPAKVALTAIMRKQLILLSSVMKRGTPWQPDYADATT